MMKLEYFRTDIFDSAAGEITEREILLMVYIQENLIFHAQVLQQKWKSTLASRRHTSAVSCHVPDELRD
ncbi:hypothetical protein OIU78_008025, partial [Salix suchowensis]